MTFIGKSSAHSHPVRTIGFSVLTDRGTEYCGSAEHHEYRLYPGIEGMEHTKTKARSLQNNRTCERFQKTMLQEFYQIAFCKKLCESIDQLQQDLDRWLKSRRRLERFLPRCLAAPG